MGFFYSFALKVGYSMYYENFINVFGKVEEGAYHWEDRFDPKTGKKKLKWKSLG